MTKPGTNEEDRSSRDTADEPAAPPEDAAPQQDAEDDDVQGHAYTGALKDKERFA